MNVKEQKIRKIQRCYDDYFIIPYTKVLENSFRSRALQSFEQERMENLKEAT